MIGVNDGFFTFVDAEQNLVNSVSNSQSATLMALQEIMRNTRGDLEFMSNIVRQEMEDIKILNKKVSGYYLTLLNVGRIYQFKTREGIAKIKSQHY